MRHHARRQARSVLPRRFGDLTLAQLRTPTYAPVWNVEHNRLDFVGPRTHPDMPVARAIRMAVSLPLFVQPVPLDGLSWCDGGIVDIFPVRPVLDIEPAVDIAVAVNGFYPHEFGGEDVTGWNARPFSIVAAASQVRTCQQAELTREHLARLRGQARTLLVEPVPYQKVAGAGFYEQFLDTRQWPQLMRAGREAMLTSLRRHAPPPISGRFGSLFARRRRRLIRRSGNDAELTRLAVATASAISAWHVFVIMLNGGFPVMC